MRGYRAYSSVTFWLGCTFLAASCSDDDQGSGAGGTDAGSARGGTSGAGGSGTSGSGGTSGTSGTAGVGALDSGPGGAGGTGGRPPGAACAPNPSLQAHATLGALADNTALDLGAFTCTIPESDDYNCAQVTDYSGMVYDCKGHRLLMFGGGHATTFTDTIFAFDFATLKWNELYAPTPCTASAMSNANFDKQNATWQSGPTGPYPRPLSRHTYDLTAYVDTLDQFLLLVGPNGDSGSCPPGSTGYTFANPEANVAHYDLTGRAWSSSANSAGNGRLGNDYPASELDPVSKKVLLVGGGGLFIYDPVARTRTVAIDNYNQNVFGQDLGYANHLVYFPPNDRFYYFHRNGGVWELSVNRGDFTQSSLTMLAVTGPDPTHGEPGFDYDSKNQIIGGAVDDGRFFAFDPVAKTWQALSMQGATGQSQAFHAISYDPVNNVFVFVTESRRTFAYRYKR